MDNIGKYMNIESGSFNGLSSLEILNLSNNKIEIIKPGTFNGLSSLEILNLSDNKIEKIEFGLFKDLKKLTSLDLRNNQFSSYSKFFITSTFYGLPKTVKISY